MFLKFISDTFPKNRTKLLDDYYNNNYIKNCDASKFGYLDSWEFLATTGHWFTIFSLPFNIFGGYCILFKTPPKMNRVKWIMFNMQCWTTIVDILLTSMSTPYIFYPAVCGFPVGILQAFRVSIPLQLYLIQTSFGGLMTSFLMMFEFRHHALSNTQMSTRNRIIYISTHYIISFFILLPVYLNLPDQDSAKLVQLQNKIPCPALSFFDGPVFVFTNTLSMEIAYYGIYMAANLFEMTFFFFHSLYIVFENSLSKISDHTKNMQKKFLMITLLQVAIPLVIICIPSSVLLYYLIFEVYNQHSINLAILFMSLHGTAATVTMVLINDPYREFLRSIFKPKERDVNQGIRVFLATNFKSRFV